MTDPTDPLRLLRHPEPVAPYPNEASDEELAAEVGLEPGDLVRMDMNTLGGGPLPAVAAAMPTAAARVVEYGDLAYARLRAAVSAASGASPGRIVPGAGADELIRLITTQVVGRDDAVVIPTPTFGMFAVEAGFVGARIVTVARDAPGERQPVARIRAAAEANHARLVWICTPNNPTGDAYGLDEVRRLAAGLETVVAVDEVYVELAEASADVAPGTLSAISLIDELPNLVVVRSLSKAYGLAGARVGYLVAGDALAGRFDHVRLSLSVAGPSQALAVAALGDLPAARARHRQIVAERERIATRLDGLGWPRIPSVTNFIAFRPPDGAGLARRLHRRGIVLRSYDDGPMAGWLRVTVRSPLENDQLLAALERDA